jgi:subtilase family serine protease
MTPSVGDYARWADIGVPEASGSVVFRCQQRTVATCYGPDQIRAAYGFDKLPAGISGAGQTIVIIDAFGSPTIRTDLAVFDAVWGLSNPTLNIITPDGLPAFDYHSGNMVGWAGETSLDVEWAHAIAPGATIDLVLSKTNDDADILSAQQYVVEHNLGSVLSQSFGEGESCMLPAIQKHQHQAFRKALAERMTVFASSGDQGAAQAACDGSHNFFLSASTPASDPLVTGVGGTTLNADLTTGAYNSETAWTDAFGRSGGGYSTLYERPGFQEGAVKSEARGVPDVAYNAGVDGGVIGAFSFPDPTRVSFYRFGGTSAGSPQWAALAALADQTAGRPLGYLNKSLYAIGGGEERGGAFNDITVGDNTWVYMNDAGQVATIPGFSAAPGWDAVTGLGTPKADKLIPILIAHRNGEGGDNAGQVAGNQNGEGGTSTSQAS